MPPEGRIPSWVRFKGLQPALSIGTATIGSSGSLSRTVSVTVAGGYICFLRGDASEQRRRTGENAYKIVESELLWCCLQKGAARLVKSQVFYCIQIVWGFVFTCTQSHNNMPTTVTVSILITFNHLSLLLNLKAWKQENVKEFDVSLVRMN